LPQSAPPTTKVLKVQIIDEKKTLRKIKEDVVLAVRMLACSLLIKSNPLYSAPAGPVDVSVRL
jgi:hypothetical protein